MKTSEANIEDLKGKVVSDGTMRPEDLIPKFLNVLKVYGKDVYDKYVGENPEVLDLSGMDDETMGWVVDELFDKLNEIAPEGYSFESQDGDGACYGFWSEDADESKKGSSSSKKDTTRKYYGYAPDEPIPQDDTDLHNAVIMDWFAKYLPQDFVDTKADRLISDVTVKNMREYEEIVTMDDFYAYLDKYGPDMVADIKADMDESKKNEDASEIKVGDFVEYDKDGKEDWNWAEVTGVNEDGTLNLHITDMNKTNYDDVDNVPAASCHKLPRFAGMTDTGHYYMDGPINLYKGGWEICVTKKDLDPSKYEFIGTIDSYEDMPQVDAYYDDNYVYDVDDESEVREYFGVDFPEGAVTFADFKKDVVGESKKCEAYIQPVTLYSTTRYDDAEAVQSFLRDIGGDAVTVDKQRNGDVLSVNVSGSDDDVEAFVDTYKNEYGSIVKDCEVDATGWTAPEDIYYTATEQGRKELRGESKKGEAAGETMRVDVYADKRNFDPEEFVKYVRKVGGENGGYISVDSVVSVDVLNKANRLAQANDYKRAESKKREGILLDDDAGEIALKKLKAKYSQYRNKSTSEIAADVRYDVATALDMAAEKVDGLLAQFGLDNLYVLRSKGYTPKQIAQKILAAKNTESLDPAIDVKGRGVVELCEDDYLKLSRDINSRGYCKDKDGAYNVWIGGSFKGTFPSVEAAADAGYTLVEGKRCESDESKKNEASPDVATIEGIKSLLGRGIAVVDNELRCKGVWKLNSKNPKQHQWAYVGDNGAISIKTDDDSKVIRIWGDLNKKSFDLGVSENNEESKKSESLTLKQKELKDMARFGEAEDITTISDVEAKELKKKGIETVGISRGVYGMNGALLRDKDGKKYVITARSSNLFYFV